MRDYRIVNTDSIYDNIASDFSTTTDYAVNDFCYHDGVLYRCTTAHSAGAWDASHFTTKKLTECFESVEEYHAKFVADEFNSATVYHSGDHVMYNERYYRCITTTTSGQEFQSDEWIEVTIENERDSAYHIYTAKDLQYVLGLSGNKTLLLENDVDYNLESPSNYNVKYFDLQNHTLKFQWLYDETTYKTADALNYVYFQNGIIIPYASSSYTGSKSITLFKSCHFDNCTIRFQNNTAFSKIGNQSSYIFSTSKFDNCIIEGDIDLSVCNATTIKMFSAPRGMHNVNIDMSFYDSSTTNRTFTLINNSSDSVVDGLTFAKQAYKYPYKFILLYGGTIINSYIQMYLNDTSCRTNYLCGFSFCNAKNNILTLNISSNNNDIDKIIPIDAAVSTFTIMNNAVSINVANAVNSSGTNYLISSLIGIAGSIVSNNYVQIRANKSKIDTCYGIQGKQVMNNTVLLGLETASTTSATTATINSSAAIFIDDSCGFISNNTVIVTDEFGAAPDTYGSYNGSYGIYSYRDDVSICNNNILYKSINNSTYANKTREKFIAINVTANAYVTNNNITKTHYTDCEYSNLKGIIISSGRIESNSLNSDTSSSSAYAYSRLTAWNTAYTPTPADEYHNTNNGSGTVPTNVLIYPQIVDATSPVLKAKYAVRYHMDNTSAVIKKATAGKTITVNTTASFVDGSQCIITYIDSDTIGGTVQNGWLDDNLKFYTECFSQTSLIDFYTANMTTSVTAGTVVCDTAGTPATYTFTQNGNYLITYYNNNYSMTYETLKAMFDVTIA